MLQLAYSEMESEREREKWTETESERERERERQRVRGRKRERQRWMAHKRDKPGKSCCKCVLQKTMKGADKAIVAKSFGKWHSSSQRSRTMEKPDGPRGEGDAHS